MRKLYILTDQLKDGPRHKKPELRFKRTARILSYILVIETLFIAYLLAK